MNAALWIGVEILTSQIDRHQRLRMAIGAHADSQRSHRARPRQEQHDQ
jgi:hypothetical protein